jgi:UDP-N-acetylmuramoyl-tripeptide--D-alanyl-D-alanine ligase
MKELLLTVFSEGKKVAATPANKNVASSHAQFAASLRGDEDILLIEYGEGAPGDITSFARTTYPDCAVITGVAAAHLDQYKTVEAAGKDIFGVADYVEDRHVCVNIESPAARPFMKPTFMPYNRSGALGWKVSDVKISLSGTKFTLKKGKQTLQLESTLLGRHQLGPLSLSAALAGEFGLSNEQIIQGVAKTAPFEHRMHPYQLNGAWVIDDTYNGNIEGIRAGTELLKELPAKRKLYVTPGLVDQGAETQAIHEEMGRLIATSGANLVVLMRNSVTDFIKRGLEASHFQGEIIIETDPLGFYTNLNHFVASGDLALLQNDWPDNYA